MATVMSKLDVSLIMKDRRDAQKGQGDFVLPGPCSRRKRVAWFGY
jgi:hypothetical protein